MPKNNNQNKNALRTVPVAKTKVTKTEKPKFQYLSNGDIIVSHRQYIGQVSGSVDFEVSSYPINPGLSQTFPWLGEFIAPGYETYREHALAFEYETEVAATKGGSVMLGVDYDASDAAPLNKQQLMTYSGAVRSAIWNPVVCRLEQSAMHKLGPQKFIRQGTVTDDIKTFDVGNLFVATQGCADSTEIGELYVVYRTQFYTPQLNIQATIDAKSVRIDGGGTVSKTAIYGTVPVYAGGLNVTAADSTLTFNRVGQYLVNLNIPTAVATTSISMTLTGTSTANVIQDMNNSGATARFTSIRVIVNDRGATLIVDFSGATSVSASQVRIAPYLHSLG